MGDLSSSSWTVCLFHGLLHPVDGGGRFLRNACTRAQNLYTTILIRTDVENSGLTIFVFVLWEAKFHTHTASCSHTHVSIKAMLCSWYVCDYETRYSCSLYVINMSLWIETEPPGSAASLEWAVMPAQCCRLLLICPVGIGQRSQIISDEGQLEEAYANF